MNNFLFQFAIKMTLSRHPREACPRRRSGSGEETVQSPVCRNRCSRWANPDFSPIPRSAGLRRRRSVRNPG